MPLWQEVQNSQRNYQTMKNQSQKISQTRRAKVKRREKGSRNIHFLLAIKAQVFWRLSGVAPASACKNSNKNLDRYSCILSFIIRENPELKVSRIIQSIKTVRRNEVQSPISHALAFEILVLPILQIQEMSFGRPPSINLGFKPTAPDRGSFPLDHYGNKCVEQQAWTS